MKIFKKKKASNQVKSPRIKPKPPASDLWLRGHGRHPGAPAQETAVSQRLPARPNTWAPAGWGDSLRVGEHVLLQVLPPHEQLVAVVTLEVLLAGVDDHV